MTPCASSGVQSSAAEEPGHRGLGRVLGATSDRPAAAGPSDSDVAIPITPSAAPEPESDRRERRAFPVRAPMAAAPRSLANLLESNQLH
jgi:hypothetical protein